LRAANLSWILRSVISAFTKGKFSDA
jgi:hypothetical protein